MTVKDFIKLLNRHNDLISLLFGQRKSGVKREYIENTLYTDSKRFDLLLNNGIIQETGHDIIRLNESISRFFEDFLNIGEQIDTAYIVSKPREEKETDFTIYLCYRLLIILFFKHFPLFS